MQKTIKKILWSYIKTVWKKKLFLIIFFGIFSSFISVIEPIIFIQIIKKIEEFQKTWFFDYKIIVLIMIFWWFFILFTLFINFINDYYFIGKTTVKNYIDEWNKYTKKIINMNYSDFLWKKQWSLYKIFDRGTEQQCQFLIFLLQDVLKSLSGILIIIIILFYIDWRMALVTISLVPVMFFIGIFFIKKVSPHQKKINDKWDSIFANIGNILSSFALTKTLTLEKQYRKKIWKTFSKLYEKQININKYWTISNIYTWTIVMISRILVIWFWIFFIIDGSLSFAYLFLFFSYISWIYYPLWFLFSKLKNLNEQITAVEKLHKEFDTLDLEDINIGKNIYKIKWNIEFKNVIFSYNKKWKKILNNISFSVKNWEKIAFVWNTWAGKSTIINLILRFWNIEKGEILLDWENISLFNKKSVRENIGFVSQDISLFNDSIRNNLLFAKPDATDIEIKNAINKSESQFVFELNKWLDTVVGERWLKLSWWEKQRLAIARLFLKNPKILILDEATSALDNKTEKLIQKSIDKLMKWRTTLVIAHRLSTIQNSDKIFMLEKWQIVEYWKYEELISKKGKFFELANPDNLILK